MNLYVFKEIYSICRSRHRQFRVSKKCKMKGPKTVYLVVGQFLLLLWNCSFFSSKRIERQIKRAPIFTKKSCIEIGLEATRTIVQIQQFFFNSTELGKIEEQNWVERQNGAGSNLFSHEQKFFEMNLEEMPLEKLLKIQQSLSIKLIRLKWVKSNCKIVWSGKTERPSIFFIK